MAGPQSRGHLTPDLGPPVLRLPPPPEVSHLVRHFWIPEWDLPAGVVHRQLVLTYPAVNLAVEPSGIAVYGPHTTISHRDLSGRGWAVGALLLPAAVPLVTDDVRGLVDSDAPLAEPTLHADVAAQMAAQMHNRHPDRHANAVRRVAAWLTTRARDQWPDGIPAEALLANRLFDTVHADDTILRLDDLADRLGLSPRTVQRFAARYVGLTPAAMIRRRRLQDAADRVRAGAALAEVATELGYADQAHLTRDFRLVLGFTPGEFRSA